MQEAAQSRGKGTAVPENWWSKPCYSSTTPDGDNIQRSLQAQHCPKKGIQISSHLTLTPNKPPG